MPLGVAYSPIAPSIAIPMAMKKAGVTDDQVALYEINEAFAAVALANIQILKLDPKKVNAVRRPAFCN